jgi:hypothetical protein
MGQADGRTRLQWFVAVALILICGVVVARAGGWLARPAASRPVAQVVGDDAGDDQATTSFDAAMVRKRAALAVHPEPGADRAHIARELRAAAVKAGAGGLTDATFAVFSADMLDYLVPEMTFVFDEGVTVERGEAFIRDFKPGDVAFTLVEPVLVHDLTFAVIPAAGVTAAAAKKQEDREGILADSLNHYQTTVQRAGLTVRYFGAIISDGQVLAVRAAMGRAAQVPAGQVQVEATEPGPGVDLSHGVPSLKDAPHRHS